MSVIWGLARAGRSVCATYTPQRFVRTVTVFLCLFLFSFVILQPPFFKFPMYYGNNLRITACLYKISSQPPSDDISQPPFSLFAFQSFFWSTNPQSFFETNFCHSLSDSTIALIYSTIFQFSNALFRRRSHRGLDRLRGFRFSYEEG
jgi:hypothetical protein